MSIRKKAWSGVVYAAAIAVGAMTAVPSWGAESTSTMLAHRWSFNGDYTDSAGGLTGTPTGNLTFTDGNLVLPGGNKGTANVDLGANALSVGSDSVTIEIWMKQVSMNGMPRIFDYYVDGNTDNDIYISCSRNSDITLNRVELRYNATSTRLGNDPNCLAPYTLGTWYHVSMVLQANGSETIVKVAKRETGTGAVESSAIGTINWTLSDFHNAATSPHLYLGRSLYTEKDANIEYGEVRVWRGELSDAQLDFNAAAGPDRLPRVVEVHRAIAGETLLAHRWSFNGDYSDSIGNLTAVTNGSPTISDGKVLLPGGVQGTGNVDLGANALSVGTNDVTIEIWMKQVSMNGMPRVFDYYVDGNKNNDIYISCSRDNDITQNRVQFTRNNSWVRLGANDSKCLSQYTLGTWYHLALVFQASGSGTAVAVAKRDAGTGAISSASGTINWTLSDFHSSAISPHLYLGRSLYGEKDANIEYDEVRVWKCALTSQQLDQSMALGADVLPSFEVADVACAVARWTGNGAAGDVEDPLNWDCRDSDGNAMPNTTLPDLHTKVVFASAMDFDIPSNSVKTLCCAEVSFENVVLAQNRDLSGIPATCRFTGSIDLAGNKLTLANLLGTAAITDTSIDAANPGELHVATHRGDVSAGDVALSGNLRFVKDGAAALTVAKTGQTYTGGTLVAAGTLKLGVSASQGSLGTAGSGIRIERGATLDANGTYNNYAHDIVLNGGTLANTVAMDTPHTKYHFGNVRLEADSYFRFRCGGLVNNNSDALTLDLQGHKLYWWGYNDANYLWNADVTAGTIELAADGTLTIPRNYSTRASAVKFIAKGQFSSENTLSIGDYICESTKNPVLNKAGGKVFVSGTFKPVTDWFWGCVLQGGATLDLSEKDETWSTTGKITLSNVSKTVTFADNAVITIDVGTRKFAAREKIVSWTNTPTNLATLQFKLSGTCKGTAKVASDGIYYRPSGFIIIIK